MVSLGSHLGGQAKHDGSRNSRDQGILLIRGDHGADGRAERASRAGNHAQVAVAVVDAQRAPPVANQVRRAGEEDDAPPLTGEGADEAGALWNGERRGGVDAALGHARAEHGLDLGLVALDHGEGARCEERLHGLAADRGCPGAGDNVRR